MQLGMVGLGRMGANMVRRLLRGGHRCVVFDMAPKAVSEVVEAKAIGSSSLQDLVTKLGPTAPPRAYRMRAEIDADQRNRGTNGQSPVGDQSPSRSQPALLSKRDDIGPRRSAHARGDRY
jgi:hypothetical protein